MIVVIANPNAGAVLGQMGYRLVEDFIACPVGNDTRVDWLSAQTMPTEAAINAFDMSPGAVAARALAALYVQAKALLTADDAISKKEKAVLLVILDEFNAHATKINAIMTAIDNAATFAAMKTAIAAIADYPQRTASQIKTSVAGKIDGGLADG